MNFLYWLQNLRNPFLDYFFSIISAFGEELLVLGVLCLVYWCINKRTAFMLCFTYFISGLMVQGLKVAFCIERPWIRDARLHPVSYAVEGATGYSFPSGHTQGVTGLFSTIALYVKKAKIFIINFIIIALVMLSRMYLGCHTPADVLVSFSITFVTSIIVTWAFNSFNSTKTTNVITFALIELISAGLIVFALCKINSHHTTTELAMDCLKAAGSGIGFGIGWFIEETFIKYDPLSINSVWGQILKFILGLVIALVLKEGIKMLFGTGIAINIIRYCIIVIWIVAGYPAILKKIFG